MSDPKKTDYWDFPWDPWQWLTVICVTGFIVIFLVKFIRWMLGAGEFPSL